MPLDSHKLLQNKVAQSLQQQAVVSLFGGGRWIARKSQDSGGDGRMTPLLRLSAGAGAGIIAMSATYPLDMVRGRLTVQEALNKQYKGIFHCASVIAREVASIIC